jgi:hypothetical protein
VKLGFVDKELLLVLGLAALTFLFMLPSWTPVEPKLDVESVTFSGNSLEFSLNYQAPERKSCFLVFYGPFRYDGAGHEVGNNIYVLTDRVGSLEDTLPVRVGENMTSLDVEMWCDNDKVAESVVPL